MSNFAINDTVALESTPTVAYGDITAIAKGWITVNTPDGPAKHRARHLVAYEAPVVDEQADEEQEGDAAPVSMAAQLAAARQRYVKSKSAMGKASMHNGDELASALSGCTPRESCDLADRVINRTDDKPAKQTCWNKYQHLNPGQQRMNSGNLIRSRVKKGLITVDEVLALMVDMA